MRNDAAAPRKKLGVRLSDQADDFLPHVMTPQTNRNGARVRLFTPASTEALRTVSDARERADSSDEEFQGNSETPDADTPSSQTLSSARKCSFADNRALLTIDDYDRWLDQFDNTLKEVGKIDSAVKENAEKVLSSFAEGLLIDFNPDVLEEGEGGSVAFSFTPNTTSMENRVAKLVKVAVKFADILTRYDLCVKESSSNKKHAFQSVKGRKREADFSFFKEVLKNFGGILAVYARHVYVTHSSQENTSPAFPGEEAATAPCPPISFANESVLEFSEDSVSHVEDKVSVVFKTIECLERFSCPGYRNMYDKMIAEFLGELQSLFKDEEGAFDAILFKIAGPDTKTTSKWAKHLLMYSAAFSSLSAEEATAIFFMDEGQDQEEQQSVVASAYKKIIAAGNDTQASKGKIRQPEFSGLDSPSDSCIDKIILKTLNACRRKVVVQEKLLSIQEERLENQNKIKGQLEKEASAANTLVDEFQQVILTKGQEIKRLSAVIEEKGLEYAGLQGQYQALQTQYAEKAGEVEKLEVDQSRKQVVSLFSQKTTTELADNLQKQLSELQTTNQELEGKLDEANEGNQVLERNIGMVRDALLDEKAAHVATKSEGKVIVQVLVGVSLFCGALALYKTFWPRATSDAPEPSSGPSM